MMDLDLTGHVEGADARFDLSIVRRGRRYFYVVNWSDPTAIEVFDLRGVFLRKVGQFGRIIALEETPGDSVLVLDHQRKTWTLLDPGLEVARVVSIPVVPEENSVCVLSSDLVLLSGQIQTRDLVGIPYHVFSAEGTRVRSFGEPQPRRARTIQFLRFPTLWHDGTIWVARHNEYILSHWTEDGKELPGFSPDRPWFSTWVGADSTHRQREGTPSPAIMDLAADESQRLWVVGRVADPNWPEPLKPGLGSRLPPDAGAFYDAVLDVYDTNEPALLAATRLDAFILGFADSSHVYGHRRGTSPKTISVWQVRLRENVLSPSWTAFQGGGS